MGMIIQCKSKKLCPLDFAFKGSLQEKKCWEPNKSIADPRRLGTSHRRDKFTVNKKTLISLFAESLFQIPDYQRGYAWEDKQWKDFIDDIDALVYEQETSHYTGTVVVYAGRDAEIRAYGTKRLKVVDVVDGQQRLTTSCLYLAEIIRALVRKGESDYENDISDCLYSGAVCKLTLNNDTGHIFYDLLRMGHANIAAQTPQEKRLVKACTDVDEADEDGLEA
jgi:hypothetical protein